MTEAVLTEVMDRPKTRSSTQWHAFVMSEAAQVVSAPSQKELKKQLNALGDAAQVLGIVKGKFFQTKMTRMFEIVEAEVPEWKP